MGVLSSGEVGAKTTVQEGGYASSRVCDWTAWRAVTDEICGSAQDLGRLIFNVGKGELGPKPSPVTA